MASISATGSKGHHKFTLTVVEDSCSIENNTSKVSFTFVMDALDSSCKFNTWGNSLTYQITIDGTSYSGNLPDYREGTRVEIRSGSQSVTHNVDGTKSISYEFSVTDKSGVTYTPGNASANGTLQLTDIARAHTITFDTNGGSGTISKTGNNGSSYIMPSAYKKGHTLLGWYTSASGGTRVGGAGDSATYGDSDKTYYAQWAANTYTIHFEGNGATSGTVSDVNMTYDVQSTLPVNGFLRTNYTFVGWASFPTTKPIYTNRQSVMNLTPIANGVVTLYAVWESNLFNDVHANIYSNGRCVAYHAEIYDGTKWVPVKTNIGK